MSRKFLQLTTAETETILDMLHSARMFLNRSDRGAHEKAEKAIGEVEDYIRTIAKECGLS